MEKFKPRRSGKSGPETILSQNLQNKLRLQDWFVKKTHGSEYQSGLPDLYIAHLRYGTRWVETKILGHYRFTPAQIKTFREMAAAGVGIWILVDDTEYEMKKLFLPPNWHLYLKW